MNIVLLGAPGAGKGSQAKVIAREYGIAHVSTGDAFRDNIAQGTPIGKIAKRYVDKGQLVPDSVVMEIVKYRLSQADCSKGFVLDGFPRTIAQAESLSAICNIDLVINIAVSDEIVIKRISGRRVCKCGQSYHVSTHPSDTCDICGKHLYVRDDDKEETVMERLEVYKKQTMPLIEYYSDRELLKNVDGETSIEDTFRQVKLLLDSIA